MVLQSIESSSGSREASIFSKVNGKKTTLENVTKNRMIIWLHIVAIPMELTFSPTTVRAWG